MVNDASRCTLSWHVAHVNVGAVAFHVHLLEYKAHAIVFVGCDVHASAAPMASNPPPCGLVPDELVKRSQSTGVGKSYRVLV